MTTHLEFFGSDKSRGSLEAIALRQVPSSLLRQEADLFDLKWFEYRTKHPVWATYYWAHCYVTAGKRFCLQNFDQERASKIRIISDDDIFKTRDAVAAVTARQSLDKIGCRYEWAMYFITQRFSERGWFALPRPNQLYGEELTLDIADAWKTECAASLQIPKDPLFRASGEPTHTQADYIRWITKQVNARGVDKWRSVSRLLSEQIITREAAASAFGEDVTQRAESSLGIGR